MSISVCFPRSTRLGWTKRESVCPGRSAASPASARSPRGRRSIWPDGRNGLASRRHSQRPETRSEPSCATAGATNAHLSRMYLRGAAALPFVISREARMSHHFDTPTAREDPRINVCDFYLFRGRPGFTVMAMTVNPNDGQSGPDTFREEGLYAFRFDLDGDAREELSFKVTFGPPFDADGDDHKHEQIFEVRRSPGAAALKGANGDLIAAGTTGAVVKSKSGVTAFAGLAPDLFAVDAAAF